MCYFDLPSINSLIKSIAADLGYLNFGNLMIFSKHHNISEKFEKSVIPVVSYRLIGRILFSVTFKVETQSFAEFEWLFKDFSFTAATLAISNSYLN